MSEVIGAVLRSGSVPCVPYRLSKLTRYLQDTLHAAGARCALFAYPLTCSIALCVCRK